jgi:thiol:disulfide interchange protein DsbD
VLGFSSALVVGPCVTAPLAGALLYIAQGGDWRLGALALFALGMGKGLPLIVMAGFGGRLLPRAGRWMQAVRRLFGFGFIAMAIWIAAPLLPQGFDLALYAMVALALAADLALRSRALWSKSASLMLAVAASSMVIASLADGATTPPAPARISLSASVPPRSPLRFVRTETIEGLVKQFEAADGKPIMVYVTADWCVICRSIERGVLPVEEVVNALKDMHLVKLDVTDFSKDTQALLNELKVAGPPTVMFFDAARREVAGTRLIGGMSSAELAQSARRAGGSQ